MGPFFSENVHHFPDLVTQTPSCTKKVKGTNVVPQSPPPGMLPFSSVRL